MASRPPGRIRNVTFLGTLLVPGVALFVQACTQREVVGVVTGSVVVSPATASVQEGGTLQLTDVVRDQDGDVLDAAVVDWSSLDPTIATVDENGMVTGVLRGTATIRATHNGVSGTAEITVLQSAGITISQISGPTTEAGGTATFTVVLDSRPDADVTIGLSSSAQTEGLVSPTSLTFTPTDWDTEQTVTVIGQNDDVADGNVTHSIVTAPAVSTDLRYAGLNAVDVQVTNNDNDTSGISVSPVNKPTTEAGGIATFTIVLTSKPTGDVKIGVSSSTPTEGAVNVSSVTFTTTNWGVPQTVIVTGKDDAEADGNADYFIVTAPAESTDATYSGMDATDVAVTNIDDETAGITVSPPTGPTREDGGQATFTVVLNARPTGNVTITIAMSSSDVTEGTISTPSIVFTQQNWNVAQTITVTGQDDDIDDGDRPYTVIIAPATSGDPNYHGLDAPDVAMTNVDDETAGITVSPPNGPTTEDGGTAWFTVVLNSEPTADVTITFASSNTAEATVITGPVTFTKTNWYAPRQVNVRGENDAMADGNVAYAVVIAPATSTDPLYNGLDASDVPMTNVDDETPGITLSAPSGPTTEAGGTARFTVVLNTQPTDSVTIALSSSDPSEGTVSPTSLTFRPSGADVWSTPQTVTVTGQNDALDDGDVVFDIVTEPATSDDPNYSGRDPANVAITNIDDETAGITVSAMSGPTTEDGGTATFTVVLTSQPTGNVTVGVASSDPTEGAVTNPASGTLTFTPSGPGIWSTPQEVTVRGQNDDSADGNIVYTIVTAPATSTDPSYSGLNPQDVSATNVDNETPGITVSPVSGPTTEAGGQAAFTVVLNTEPTAGVTIGITSSDLTEGVVSPSSLTFGTGNWSTPQTVTVTGQDDVVDDDNVVYTIVTALAVSSDPGYSGLDAADVTVTNVDDDASGVTVTPASGPTTEAGGTATFTIRLNSQPTANVTIGFTSSDLTEGTVSPSSITFTPSGGATIWSNPRTVTVTGVNDVIDDDNVVYSIVTAPATSTDPRYNGLNAPDVTITNVDDDAASITVSPVSGPTTEAGGTATFTVVLSTAPSANVTIGLSSSDPTEGTLSTGLLTFTPSGAGIWSTPQIVTITGQNDALDDGDIQYTIVSAPASSADARYNGLNPQDLSVTNTDNDQAGIVISPPSGPTTEAGGTATFTVVLTSEPTADVTLGITSSDTSEGVVTSPTPLTFTNANWSTPQTVTVTGQNDPADDGDVAYTIVTAPATSSDPSYGGMNAANVAMTNVDDENAGITVSPISGPTTEGGGQATFTVVLTTAPSSDVVIGLTSSDPTEGTVAPGSLTFRPSGAGLWSTPQTVTVTGVNDFQQDGNVVYTIVTAPATSADPSYDDVNAADVSVTNVDDETAGITVSAISGVTTEDGGTASFTVILNSQPTANVTVGVTSSDLTEGTVAPSTLTFTPTDGANAWNNPHTVTVTGVNDFLDDGNIPYTIVTGTSASSDANYNGINPSDVSVTNVDDDVAGVTVSPSSGPTTEDGGTATFTLVLNSQPTAVVSIAVASSDPTEGDVISATPIEFNSGNWNVPRTVTVQGQDDDIDDEIVSYSIITTASSSDPQYNGVAIADVPMTNVDDTDQAGITVTPTTGLVTTETNGTAQFTVVLTSEPIANVTIGVSSGDTGEGQVTAGATLVFTAGNWDVPQTVTITGQNDFIDDGNVGYTIVTAAATSSDPRYSGRNAADVSATNNDDADTAGILVTPTNGLIATESGGTDDFTIVLTSEPLNNVTIAVRSLDAGEGTVAPTLVTFTPSTVGANAWNNPHTVTVTGVNDNLDDGNQVFTIETDPAQSTDPLYLDMPVDDVTATTIDIHAASLAINNASVAEGDASSANMTFTVTLSVPSTQTVTVQYATSPGSATAGSDYTTISNGTLTFVPGDVSEQLTVPVLGDVLDEANETFNVNLSAPTNATIADGLGVGTINDNDPAPALSINDASVTEVDAGTAVTTFTVTLSAASGQTVTVQYATSNGTASAGSDYTATTGMLTFVAGDVSEQITVPVAGDVLDEANETFNVNLSAPSNATIADGLGVGNINDNDPAPTLSIGDASLTEGNTGTANMTFAVTLSAASGQQVTVQYATAAGTATAGSDYTTTNGTLTFVAGDVSEQVIVPVLGDVLDEANETLTVNLSGATNATILDGVGVGTILDNDDPAPTISIGDASLTEGNTGTANMTFTVTLSAASGQEVTVQYATAAGTATAGADYTTTSGTLTFVAGDVSEPIDVPVIGDLADELSETFNVNLSVPTNATILDGTGVGSIDDNDPPPTISIGDASLTEGSGGGNMTFTVTLSATSYQTVTVQYVTANGSAASPGDYTSTSGTLTFVPGDVSEQFNVAVNNDVFDEADETFNVNLSAPSNATIGDGTGVGTIIDDNDPMPTMSIFDAQIVEGDSGTLDMTFDVRLSFESGQTITVQYTTSPGTATAGTDYETTSGTLTFIAGDIIESLNVVVIGDQIPEGTETFTVTLSSPTNVTILDGTATGTITDN